jgi:hypothetical protein
MLKTWCKEDKKRRKLSFGTFLFPFLLLADMVLLCNLPCSRYIEYSYHFFWNLSILPDISDVEESKIGITDGDSTTKVLLILLRTQLHLMDRFLQTVSFSCAMMRAMKLMTICWANSPLINIMHTWTSGPNFRITQTRGNFVLDQSQAAQSRRVQYRLYIVY